MYFLKYYYRLIDLPLLVLYTKHFSHIQLLFAFEFDMHEDHLYLTHALKDDMTFVDALQFKKTYIGYDNNSWEINQCIHIQA